jgi:hypothetical protein
MHRFDIHLMSLADPVGFENFRTPRHHCVQRELAST